MNRFAVVVTLLALAGAAAPPTPPKPVALPRMVIDGTINPAVAGFVHESIGRAEADGAPALLIELDTPGGLLDSMRAIVKDILAARVPVIVWVAPSGAEAGSAGVFITLAAHIAAMAPGTNIGAAHPVGGGGEDIQGKLGEKIVNATASFSEAIARQRGRNVEWAAQAVRESKAIAAEEAARRNVVDFVARDLAELVQRADGRRVDVAGERRVLALANAVRGADGHVRTEDYRMRLSQQVLNVIAHPNIASLLMIAGLLGLYIEMTHPGVVFPGVAGAICLLLAFAAFQVLPVNTTGLALLVLGAALLVAEAFLPTFGVLGVGGLVAFVLGFLFLFDTAETGLAVSRPLVLGVGGAAAAAMLLIATVVVRSQWRRPRTGIEGLLGEVGVVKRPVAPPADGTVLVHGEYWTAASDDALAQDERVEVTAVEGLRLRVRRARR